MNRHTQLGVSRLLAVAGAALALLFLLPRSGWASNLFGDLEIHGFGGWAYGDTDHFNYTVGTAEGKYDNAEFALNLSAHPVEHVSVVAQVFFESNSADSSSGKDVELDYAFAEWFMNDALKLRIGRVKHPFGLYGEIFDVGTLRPFYLLPQSIYGPNGFTAKAYNGLGLTGNVAFHSGWGLQYDLYGGEIEGDLELPGLLSTAQQLLLEPKVRLGFTVKDTVGGRLVVSTPVEGLSLGGSAYRGDESIGIDVVEPGHRETYLAHAEYAVDRWTVRSEWGRLNHRGDFKEKGGYLEIAYKVTERWQLAARGEDWRVDFPKTDLSTLPSILPQLMKHKELAFGVNYWLGPSFVVRLDVHRVDGNRFAFVDSTEAVAAALATGKLEDRTRLVVLGAQFSF